MTDVEFIDLCKSMVGTYHNQFVADKLDDKLNGNGEGIKFIDESDIYVVWYCKELQNWKALLGTNEPDCMYYELTLNGDKNELYLDAYKKQNNIVINLGGK